MAFIMPNYKVSKIIENKTHLYLFFEQDVLLYLLSFDIIGTTCYINRLDSTGYKSKYKAKDFIFTILESYISGLNLIYCFSLARPCYVFKNKEKSVFSNLKLVEYWESIFRSLDKNSKLVKLNYHTSNTLPDVFYSVKDIKIFDDDPISKLIKNCPNDIDFKILYSTLCCRTDFIEGTYVFLVKTRVCDMDLENLQENKCEGEKILRLIEYLLLIDFTGKENIDKDSKRLIEYFQLKLENFEVKFCEIFKLYKDEDVKTLVGKRRR